jgi:hypothetical protein
MRQFAPGGNAVYNNDVSRRNIGGEKGNAGFPGSIGQQVSVPVKRWSEIGLFQIPPRTLPVTGHREHWRFVIAARIYGLGCHVIGFHVIRNEVARVDNNNAMPRARHRLRLQGR